MYLAQVEIRRHVLSFHGFFMTGFKITKAELDLQEKVGQLIARFKRIHFGYTFPFQIR